VFAFAFLGRTACQQQWANVFANKSEIVKTFIGAPRVRLLIGLPSPNEE
jgi:hypothetical protein